MLTWKLVIVGVTHNPILPPCRVLALTAITTAGKSEIAIHKYFKGLTLLRLFIDDHQANAGSWMWNLE